MRHDHQKATLPSYREWGPTGFDSRGLGCPDQQDWLVCPVCVTRDTPDGSVDRSNFEVLKCQLEASGEAASDGEGGDWELHSFNHWGPGWFNIILVRPGSEAAELAIEAASVMADYPVLDDMDHSQREFDAVCEYWSEMSLNERRDLIVRAMERYHAGWGEDGKVSVFCIRRGNPYDLPDNSCGRAILETLGSYARGEG
jgi:hypothetical protein